MMILSINNLIQIYFPNWCLENCCIVWGGFPSHRELAHPMLIIIIKKKLGKLTGKYGSPLLEKLKTSWSV
jgi:hypothetical protein